MMCFLFLNAAIGFSQSKITLVVDAGHGGRDPGALIRTGERESDYTFEMAKVLADYAKANNINVVMTRKRKDEFLTHQKRCGYKRSQNARVYFVSLHLDQDKDTEKKGARIYYYARSKYGTTSRVIAEKIAKALEQLNHGVATVADKDAVVLTKNEIPSVMVYCGYMTNPSDFNRSKSAAYQKQLAAIIVKAITETNY